MKKVLLIGGVGLLGYLAWQQYQKNKAGCGCKGLTDVTVVKDNLTSTTEAPKPALTATPDNSTMPANMQPLAVNPLAVNSAASNGVLYNRADLLPVN
jgi:hypothetical protein